MSSEIVKVGMLAGLTALSPSVFAQCADEGNTIAPSNAGTTHVHTVTDGCFIVEEFEFKTSANVVLSYREDVTAVGAGAYSTKGKSVFGGSSNGGSVGSCGDKENLPTVTTSLYCAGGSVGSGAAGNDEQLPPLS